MIDFNLTANLEFSNYTVLYSTLPGIVLLAIFSFTSFFSNLLLILTLIHQKYTIKNFSFNAINLAMAECIAAAGTLGAVIIRLRQIVRLASFSPFFPCKFIELWMRFGFIAVNAQTFCVSFDRLLSIQFYLWYRNFCKSESKRMSLYLINITLWLLSAIVIPAGVISGVNEHQYKICAEIYVYKPGFYTFMATLATIFALATVCCYASILIYQFRPLNAASKSVKLSKTNQIIWKSVSVHFLCQFCTWAVTGITVNIISHFDSLLLLQVEPYLGLLVLMNGILSLPLNLYFIKRIRYDFISIWKLLTICNKVSSNTGLNSNNENENY